MKAIERRINRLDKNVAQLPCNEPGHGALTVFIFTEPDGQANAEQQARIDSIKACERCKDKNLVFIMHFARALEPVPIDVTPEPQHKPWSPPINFTFNTFNGDDGSSKPEPQPKIASQVLEQPAHVRIAQWLNEKELG